MSNEYHVVENQDVCMSNEYHVVENQDACRSNEYHVGENCKVRMSNEYRIVKIPDAHTSDEYCGSEMCIVLPQLNMLDEAEFMADEEGATTEIAGDEGIETGPNRARNAPQKPTL
eukprot:1467091-Amphidinium_carterae.1